MLKMKKIILLTVVLLGAVSCVSTYEAKVNFDRNTEIETIHYKTFAWLTSSKIVSMPADTNPIMKTRIDNAIENAFVKKGYQLIQDPEKADFALSYSVGSRDQIKVTSYPAMYQGRMGWGRGYYGGSMGTETHVSQYTEGKLAIDIFDVKTHQPVWHGWAVKRLAKKQDDDVDHDAKIAEIVEQVVNQFK